MLSNKTAINKDNNMDKSRFVTDRKSIGYRVVEEKVLNWTSKGRLVGS